MKKILSSLLYMLPVALLAQPVIDRAKAPQPGHAPLITIADPATFTLPNGLKVFVVQNNKLPKVSVTLTIDIDPILEGDKAGYVEMAGSLLGRGTTTMKKEVLDEAIDFLGAELSTGSGSVSVSSLSSKFDKAFAIMADVALHPAFPKDELEKLRKQKLSELATEKEESNIISRKVINRIMYGKDHPYGDVETEATVQKITLDDVQQYYRTYWKPNAAYLVFVGDISVEKAKALSNLYFAQWQKGVLPKKVYATPQPPAKNIVAIVNRPSSVQSVISITSPIQLQPGANDAIAADVMNNVLGASSTARLFMNLREKHSYTYGAYSSLNKDKWVGSFSATASVRNEKTDSAIQQFFYEFNRIRTEAVPSDELSIVKNYLNGSFARSLEKPSTIASFALNIERYHLPKDYYRQYLTNLAAVDSNKIQQAAMKYIQPNNTYIVIVGNAQDIAKGLEKYGEIKYYDTDGNEVPAPVFKTVDAKISGEDIIKKCVQATGNTAVLTDIETNGIASFANQSFTYNEKHVLPGNYVQTFSVQGFPMIRQSLIDGKYISMQQGVEEEVGEEEKEEMNEDASFFEETYYLRHQYTYVVKGIEQVDGKDAYVVEITSSTKRTITNYYDVATGLKVKSVIVKDAAPIGKVTIQTYLKEYKTYNGLQVPINGIIDYGQYKIEINILDVKINQGLKAIDLNK